MKRIRALYERVRSVGRRVQALAVIVALWLLYTLGFGLTRVFMRLLGRRVQPAEHAQEDTCWQVAEGYGFDEEEWRRQS